MSTVLLVHHAPSPRLRRILEALETGLAHPELEGIAVESVPALATTDAPGDKTAADLAPVFDVPVNISAVLGKSHMTVAQLLTDFVELSDPLPRRALAQVAAQTRCPDTKRKLAAIEAIHQEQPNPAP